MFSGHQAVVPQQLKARESLLKQNLGWSGAADRKGSGIPEASGRVTPVRPVEANLRLSTNLGRPVVPFYPFFWGRVPLLK